MIEWCTQTTKQFKGDKYEHEETGGVILLFLLISFPASASYFGNPWPDRAKGKMSIGYATTVRYAGSGVGYGSVQNVIFGEYGISQGSMVRLELGNDVGVGQSSSVLGVAYRGSIGLSRKNSKIGKKPLRMGWLAGVHSSGDFTTAEVGVGASVLLSRRPWGWREGSVRIYGAGLVSYVTAGNFSETDPVVFIGMDWRYWDELAFGWEYYALGYSGTGWSVRYLF